MKINWNPSTRISKKAIKISELKEAGLTYSEIKKLLPHNKPYMIELKKLGDALRAQVDLPGNEEALARKIIQSQFAKPTSEIL